MAGWSADKVKRIAGTAANVDGEAIIRDAWAIHERTGDPRDAEFAKTLEARVRDLLAALTTAPRKQSHAALKRKAFRHCVRISADSPILSQARILGK